MVENIIPIIIELKHMVNSNHGCVFCVDFSLYVISNADIGKARTNNILVSEICLCL